MNQTDNEFPQEHVGWYLLHTGPENFSRSTFDWVS